MVRILHNTDKNVISKNWGANLLVKDKQGRFFQLKNKNLKQHSDFRERLRMRKREKEEEEDDEEKKKKKSEAKDHAIMESFYTAPARDKFVPVTGIVSGADKPADFSFHPDDKKQIEHSKKSLPADASKKYSVEKISDRLIEKNSLAFDEANHVLFTNLLFDFLRNRRKAPAIRELMLARLNIDDKPFGNDRTDSVMSIIKGIKAKIDASGGLVIRAADMKFQADTNVASALKKEVENDLNKKSEADVDQEIASALKEMTHDDETKELKVKVAASKPVVKNEKEKVKPKPSPAPPVPKPVAKMPEPKPRIGFDIPGSKTDSQSGPHVLDPNVSKALDSLPRVVRPSQADITKKSISDVVSKPSKLAPKSSAVEHVLTGPVQELQSLNLNDFRRLGDTPKDRIEKMVEKINLLQEDSYTKKAQGIEAWRKSYTYKLYLELGLDSMTKGIEVKELIAQQQKAGQETLTFEEFSSISDLNRQLRF